jgi:hypothetical protein
MMNNGHTKPTFETLADETLERVRGIYAQRGTEYADTWKNPPLLAMKATASKLGIDIPDEFYKVLAMAALADVKYVRLMGGYKEDSVDDGIAYNAVWAAEMRRVLSGFQEKVAVDVGKITSTLHPTDYFINRMNGAKNGLAGHTQSPELASATPSV